MERSEKHNILFLTNSIGYGGAEKMMNFVCRTLAEAGHRVTVLNLGTVSADIAEHKQIFAEKVTVVNLPQKNGNRHIAAIRCIVDIIRERKIEAIVGFTMFPNFYAKIASLTTGVPSIMSERGDPNRTITHSLKDRVMLWFINRSKGAVFQTPQAGQFYAPSLQKKAAVIPNPIFLPPGVAEQTVAARNKTIVSVGRLQNMQKRMDVMLRAFAIFSKKHPDYTLRMYGSGEMEFVKGLCADLHIEDKVQLMGAVSNPTAKIVNDGMFVITSDYEGIPNALLEAMAAGLPVVATDCTPGGARMLIEDGVNGRLVPCADPDAVADAMCQYADSPDFAEACGINARKVLTDYSPARIGKMWIDYILSVIDK